MDTGTAWRYDWHQRTINRAYHCSETGLRIKPFISIDRHFVSVTKKTIHVVIVHFVNIYGKIMWLFVLKHLNKIYSTETWSIYDDFLDLRVPSGCRRLLAIYERNQR